MIDEELADIIMSDYERINSWRLLSELPEYAGINFVTLRRYAYGDPVLEDSHRKILGLPRYELAPICPVHGVACVLDCTTQKAVTIRNSKPRKRAPRVEIPLSDPAAARAKLERKLKEYHSGLSEL